jgi:hypothetical protein
MNVPFNKALTLDLLKSMSHSSLHFVQGDPKAENIVDRFDRLFYRGEGDDYWISPPMGKLDMADLEGQCK